MQIQKPADLARIVKTRRQSQGLTQQDIADAVGITRQSVARIERGHAGASFDLVLRIFEKLDIRLDANSEDQHAVAVPAPTWNVDAPWKVAAAALMDAKNIDTSSIATSAYKNIDISAITAAATAATRNIDTSALLPKWQTDLESLTERLRENTAKVGTKITVKEARKALLNAAIEAGDPDHNSSPFASESPPPERSNGDADG